MLGEFLSYCSAEVQLNNLSVCSRALVCPTPSLTVFISPSYRPGHLHAVTSPFSSDYQMSRAYLLCPVTERV